MPSPRRSGRGCSEWGRPARPRGPFDPASQVRSRGTLTFVHDASYGTRSPAPPARPSGAAPPRGGGIDRPRLRRRLDRAVRAPLTVVTAPAGYGKRTLVRSWAARGTGVPAAVLTIGAGDGPETVARSAASVLSEVGSDLATARFVRLLERGVGGDELADSFARELARMGDTILVVESLDSAPQSNAVSFVHALLGSMARSTHMVLTARSRSAVAPLVAASRFGEPPWLTERDLAFTAQEARMLLVALSGQDLDLEVVDALLARTRGWPVGLIVAAHELRHTAAAMLVADFDRVQRHVAEYFRDEVLDRVTSDARRFLVWTSILDRMTGRSCDAVTEGHDGAAMLLHLERSGLFTSRESGARGKFTYHPMFRAVLRSELRAREPETERVLLRRAAAWYERAGLPEAAFECSSEAEDWPRVLDLVDRNAAALFASGAASDLARWLEALPVERDDRAVALRRPFVLTMAGDVRRAQQALHELDTDAFARGERVVLETLRAAWVLWSEPPDVAIRAADAVLQALDELDPREIPDVLGLTTPADLWTVAAGSRGRALWYLGDVAGSRDQLHAAARRREVNDVWRTHVLGALALLEAWAGDLPVAARHARRAGVVAARASLLEHAAMIDALLALAHVAREHGDLARARELLDRVERSPNARPVARAICVAERAACALASGNLAHGIEAIDRFRASGDPPPPPEIEGFLRAVEIRLRLASGAVDRARAVLGGRPAVPALAPVAVQVAIVAGDLTSAREVLDSWRPPPDVPKAVAERELWSAILAAGVGDRRSALRHVSAAVQVAEHLGWVAIFVDAGRQGVRVGRALLRTAPTAFLRRAVEAAAGANESGALALSERELEVVRFLPTPLSSAEIASQLYVSLNTLKTHLRTIYRKLGVASRRDAVERVEHLGLA